MPSSIFTERAGQPRCAHRPSRSRKIFSAGPSDFSAGVVNASAVTSRTTPVQRMMRKTRSIVINDEGAGGVPALFCYIGLLYPPPLAWPAGCRRANHALFAISPGFRGRRLHKIPCAKNRNSRAASALILLSSPRRKNISIPFFGNVWFAPHLRGASRSSRTWNAGCDGRGGVAGRAMLARFPQSCGGPVPGRPCVFEEGVRVRQSRVVLAPRRWCQVARNLVSRGDGGNQARSPGRARYTL